MRMFPAPSPATRPPAPGSPRGLPAPTPTSGWFERQEHAFFAKAGKEIVRVRKEGESNAAPAQAKSPVSAGPMPFQAYQNQVAPPQHSLPPLPQGMSYPPGPHPNAIPHPMPMSPHHQHPQQQQQLHPDAPMASLHSSPAPHGYPAQGQRLSPGTKPIQPIVLTPSGAPSSSNPPQHYREHTMHHQGHPHAGHHHSHSHSAHSSISSHPSPQGAHARSPASSSSTEGGPQQIPEPYDPSDPNEAWRRPMPHAERRRAGKHTRRVVVKT